MPQRAQPLNLVLMGTNTALTILSIVVVVLVLAVALWAFVIGPLWVPWHSRHQH